MRFVAIAFILLSYPALAAWLRANPSLRHWAYFGIGLFPLTLNAWNLDAGVINWGAWPGYAKGLVITIEDSLALAILTTHAKPKRLPPLAGFILAYVVAAALSVPMADTPMASVFYVFQLLRVLVIVLAVAKIAGDPKAMQWVAMGLSAGIAYQAGWTIQEKLNGAFQASGRMGHQNLLGMMTHFALLPSLAMLLAGRRQWVLMVGVVSSLIVMALGASRATIGFGSLGIVLLLLLSIRRQSTPYKARVVGLAAAALVLASPLLLNAVGNRMAQQIEHGEGYDERAAFERAAKAMWADHPMGVGANEYVVVANAKGYSARAGVVWNGGSRAANVHNMYLLVAAETGWLGLITYVLLLGAAILAGWRFAFGRRNDLRGDIALGSTVAIIVMAVHNQYEWISVTYQAQYMFAIALGTIAGLTRARALEQKEASRARATSGRQEAEQLAGGFAADAPRGV